MTIVIQHRFWDLKVEDDQFSVGLSFGGVPSMLVVPFAAVTDFVDPAVDFSLKFQANGAPHGHEAHDHPENDLPVGRAGRGRVERRQRRLHPQEIRQADADRSPRVTRQAVARR